MSEWIYFGWGSRLFMRTDGRMRGVSAVAVVTDIYFVYAYACTVFWELLAGYRISV